MREDIIRFWKYVPVAKPIYQTKFCGLPWSTVQIDADGDVMLCDCSYNMPYVIGNVYQDSLATIWKSDKAQSVRQSVLDGDFTYCSWGCGHLPALRDRGTQTPSSNDWPSKILISIDRSCNLKCASCREHLIQEKNSTKIHKQHDLFTEILQYASDNPDRQITVGPIMSGEIFASHSGLQFLKSLQQFTGDNLRVAIHTNGTLLYRNRPILEKIKHLITVVVSIDAASDTTYAQVRGGDWKELLRGLDFIYNDCHIVPSLRFCIQQKNCHEIESFADLAAKYSAPVQYQKLLDWGHWTIDWWHDNNVFDRKNSSFDLALTQLIKVKEKYPKQISFAAELTKYMEKKQTNIDRSIKTS